MLELEKFTFTTKGVLKHYNKTKYNIDTFSVWRKHLQSNLNNPVYD